MFSRFEVRFTAALFALGLLILVLGISRGGAATGRV